MFGSTSQSCYTLLSPAGAAAQFCRDIATLGPADPKNKRVITFSLQEPGGKVTDVEEKSSRLVKM